MQIYIHLLEFETIPKNLTKVYNGKPVLGKQMLELRMFLFNHFAWNKPKLKNKIVSNTMKSIFS